MPSGTTPSGQMVFVNEIHYDNALADAGEAIEVAGPAGMDLTGWCLVLYYAGSGFSYYTKALTGSIPDLCSGVRVVFVEIPGIQIN